MRMVKAAIGSVLLIGACGSDGPGRQGAEGDPANLVRLGEFDQGYLSGRLGTVSVDGVASSVEINQYEDDRDCLDCPAYTNAVVRVDRPDGSWGMTILEIEGSLTELANDEATVFVMGCSGPAPDEADWDVPANEVETDAQPDPDDPDSTILSVEVTFSDDGREPEPESETWWGDSEDQPSEARSDVVTTLLRIPR